MAAKRKSFLPKIRSFLEGLAQLGGFAGLALLIIMVISWTQGVRVELSDLWALSHKVETVHGSPECAWFDTITLPLTFFNTSSKHRPVGMLKLEVWKAGQLVDIYQANRESERFDEAEIRNWHVRNFYINSIITDHATVVKIVEFYPAPWDKHPHWTGRRGFSLMPNEEYQIELSMRLKNGRWKSMRSFSIVTGDVNKLEVDPSVCQDQVDAITY